MVRNPNVAILAAPVSYASSSFCSTYLPVSGFRLVISGIALAVSGLMLIGCSGGGNDQTKLTGGGATFPYPVYDKMFKEYRKENPVRINYQSIGSGGGVRQLKNKTVDFGASDAFLKADEMAGFDQQVVHVPTCLGAVTMAYNLEGIEDLKLTPDVIADIAQGQIKQWDHERIQELNQELSLPDKEIVFVHRSDGSGTTYIFTDYLYKTDTQWREQIGRGKVVDWPTGIGQKGNEGVTGYVKQQEGRLGYINLSYVKQSDLSTALIRNKSGNFVEPTLESTSKAGDVAMPDDTRVTLTDTDAEEGYPIAGFTWLLLYKDQAYADRKRDRVKAMLDLMWWMIHKGQQHTKPLNYAPLPENAVNKAEAVLKSVTFDGEPVLKDPDQATANAE
jgi:phosphate transport system substrate-binding protein